MHVPHVQLHAGCSRRFISRLRGCCMKERGHFSQVSLLLRLERKRRRKEGEELLWVLPSMLVCGRD